MSDRFGSYGLRKAENGWILTAQTMRDPGHAHCMSFDFVFATVDELASWLKDEYQHPGGMMTDDGFVPFSKRVR